jgi:hypothetical protein
MKQAGRQASRQQGSNIGLLGLLSYLCAQFWERPLSKGLDATREDKRREETRREEKRRDYSLPFCTIMVSRWQPHCVVVSSAPSSCAWLGASACCKSSEWHFSGVVAQATLKPNRLRLKVRVSICFVLFWDLFLVLSWCFFGLELLLRSTASWCEWRSTLVENCKGNSSSSSSYLLLVMRCLNGIVSIYILWELDESEAQLRRVDCYRLNRSVLKSALF